MAQWTEAQQQVIDTREKNMLVSAAAGSGKTAVLVERIIGKVLDNEHPVDIDRIVVVTFTRAAAAEMRERILGALEAALEQDPNNPHLLRQTTLVHNAFITTIDSFCGYIVRNHFHEIGVEPDFRIGDEGEMQLMRADAMNAMMEQQYKMAQGEKDAMFLRLIDAYGQGGVDDSVTQMILSLYFKSQSYPWPEKWLDNVKKAYEITSPEALADETWFVWLVQSMREMVEESLEKTKALIAQCHLPGGPMCYLAGLNKDVTLYEDMLVFEDATRFYEAFMECKFATIGSKRGFDGDEELLNQVKETRDAIKKKVESQRKKNACYSLEEIYQQMVLQKPVVEELVRLTNAFSTCFSEKKAKHNILDFNDVEHLALQILKDKDTRELKSAALELQNYFDEIMIDEYQDSNYIQEEILTSISKETLGKHNMFMVGDVKQSIYSFRQACPEIFTEKYKRYHQGEEGCVAIDLSKNFRSRKQVLDFTNDVFYPLMHEDLGEVEYDDAAALYLGATDYPEIPGMFDGEIILADERSEDVEDLDDYDRVAFETKIIADKIRQLQKTQQVWDKTTKQMRPMRLSDVVILMRSPKAVAGKMIEVLQENGITAYAENETGYFDAVEVETVMSLLQTIDNPFQDIPLAAVMHSPMFGFTNDDLVEITKGKKREPLILSLRTYGEEHPECEKVAMFLHFLEEKRKQVADMPIHAFIENILDETGYLSYVTAMPRGATRCANLQMLIEKAVAYEATSYKGLFHFVNYIKQLKKYEIEMGEASLVNENDDAVSIMTIHKSKGLEFPVVIVAGMGKEFNASDTKGQMILHRQMGIGLDFVDADQQVKSVPMYKNAMTKAIMRDMYGEEMRILYVAMTRAKEKLILLGTVKKAEEQLEKWLRSCDPLDMGEREGAKCYMEWVIRALASKKDAYDIQVVTPKQVVRSEVEEQVMHVVRLEDVTTLQQQADGALVRQIAEQISYEYPYRREQVYKNKYSVSEIKHQRMEDAFASQEEAKPEFLLHEVEPIVPMFISQKEGNEVSQGALRGTAMHRYLECFDFAREHATASVEPQLEEMMRKGRLLAEQKELLSLKKLQNFMESSLAQRMMMAAQRGQFYSEKPFVMSVSPKQLLGVDNADEEPVLVQGIIDVFFVEENEIVLLDYKTDRVLTTEELVKRYDAQLKLYADALGRALHLPVKEVLIYSFALEEIISL